MTTDATNVLAISLIAIMLVGTVIAMLNESRDNPGGMGLGCGLILGVFFPLVLVTAQLV